MNQTKTAQQTVAELEAIRIAEEDAYAAAEWECDRACYSAEHRAQMRNDFAELHNPQHAVNDAAEAKAFRGWREAGESLPF